MSKLKPLAVGDSVKLKYTYQVFQKDVVIYLNGKLLKTNGERSWFVEYHIPNEFGGESKTGWWSEYDIVSNNLEDQTNE